MRYRPRLLPLALPPDPVDRIQHQTDEIGLPKIVAMPQCGPEYPAPLPVPCPGNRPLNATHLAHEQTIRIIRHADTRTNAAARNKRSNPIEHRMAANAGDRFDLHRSGIVCLETAWRNRAGIQIGPPASNSKSSPQHNHAIGIDIAKRDVGDPHVVPLTKTLLQQCQCRPRIGVGPTVDEQDAHRLNANVVGCGIGVPKVRTKRHCGAAHTDRSVGRVDMQLPTNSKSVGHAFHYPEPSVRRLYSAGNSGPSSRKRGRSMPNREN